MLPMIAVPAYTYAACPDNADRAIQASSARHSRKKKGRRRIDDRRKAGGKSERKCPSGANQCDLRHHNGDQMRLLFSRDATVLL